MAEMSHFLHLLIGTDKRQRAALMSSLTSAQVDLLGEIFHNLIKVLPLNKAERKKVQRKSYLRSLASTKTAVSRRKSQIKKHSKQISDLILGFGDKLLEVARLSPLA